MAGGKKRLFELPDANESGEGIDGLNLVEFPLSVLGTIAPKNKKTLEFTETIRRSGEDITQHVILTGSDRFGLPTSTHHELLLAGIQLSKTVNNWAAPRFEFTSYELLEVARWPRTGYYYAKAAEALDIYAGLKCYYKDAWHVGGGKFRTKAFSIIDAFELYRSGKGGRGRRSAQATRDEPSYIHWGSVVFKDFQEKQTKGLDHSFYAALSSSVSKQLYRFLDKWFHYGPKFHHPDVRVFGKEKIGVSRGYKPSKIVDELNKAADELARAGYLKAASKSNRFRLRSDGVYEVFFERHAKSKRVAPGNTGGVAQSGNGAARGVARSGNEYGLAEALRERGVTNAVELVERYPAAKIESAIENFDDRNNHGEKRKGGWLRADIQSETDLIFAQVTSHTRR